MAERLSEEQLTMWKGLIDQVIGEVKDPLVSQIEFERDLFFLIRLGGAISAAGEHEDNELSRWVDKYRQSTRQAQKLYDERRSTLEGLLIARGDLESVILPSGRPLILEEREQRRTLPQSQYDDVGNMDFPNREV